MGISKLTVRAVMLGPSMFTHTPDVIGYWLTIIYTQNSFKCMFKATIYTVIVVNLYFTRNKVTYLIQL